MITCTGPGPVSAFNTLLLGLHHGSIGSGFTTFTWTDGTPVDYTEWGYNRPEYTGMDSPRACTIWIDETASVARDRIPWDDVVCVFSTDLPYVCKLRLDVFYNNYNIDNNIVNNKAP